MPRHFRIEFELGVSSRDHISYAFRRRINFNRSANGFYPKFSQVGLPLCITEARVKGSQLRRGIVSKF